MIQLVNVLEKHPKTSVYTIVKYDIARFTTHIHCIYYIPIIWIYITGTTLTNRYCEHVTYKGGNLSNDGDNESAE